MTEEADRAANAKKHVGESLEKALKGLGYNLETWPRSLADMEEGCFAVDDGFVRGRHPQFADEMFWWKIRVRPRGKRGVELRLNMFCVKGTITHVDECSISNAAQLVVVSDKGNSSRIKGVAKENGRLTYMPQFLSGEIKKTGEDLGNAFNFLLEKAFDESSEEKVPLLDDDLWADAQLNACERNCIYRKHSGGLLRGIGEEEYKKAKDEYRESSRRLKTPCNIEVDVNSFNIHPPKDFLMSTLFELYKEVENEG